MSTYIVLKAFDSAAQADEFRFLFEMMGIDASVEAKNLLVAEHHLKKAKELAEDYFRDI